MIDVNYIKNLTEKYFPKEKVKRKKIMVIDDNQDTLGIINIILSKHDFDVTISGKAKTLYELNPKTLPDLFIIDVKLQDADGRDVCNYLKHNPETENIPVILYSGNSMNELEKDMKETSADCLLSKPFTIGTLTDNIVELLTRNN